MRCGKLEKTDGAGAVYEIRKDGVVYATSALPLCGYSRNLLRQIVADGYRYCVNGKIQRKIEEGSK